MFIDLHVNYIYTVPLISFEVMPKDAALLYHSWFFLIKFHILCQSSMFFFFLINVKVQCIVDNLE